MADTGVERLTGQATATGVPVEINLIMTDRALLGDGKDSDEPAHLNGLGPIPADLARRLAVSAAEAEKAWLRRLYATPDTGRLIGMDSTRRIFPAGLAKFIEVRDQFCRTPWARREALVDRVEVRDLRRRACRSRTAKLRAA
jgi:hypothetical protein